MCSLLSLPANATTTFNLLCFSVSLIQVRQSIIVPYLIITMYFFCTFHSQNSVGFSAHSLLAFFAQIDLIFKQDYLFCDATHLPFHPNTSLIHIYFYGIFISCIMEMQSGPSFPFLRSSFTG